MAQSFMRDVWTFCAETKVSEIFSRGCEELTNKENSKRDKVRCFFICLLALFGKILYWIVEIVAIVCTVIIGAICFLGITLLSLVWYPVMILWRPRRAAEFILNKRCTDDPLFAAQLVYDKMSNFFCCTFMGGVWGMLWNVLPMKYRQHYILASEDGFMNLKKLSVKEQLAFFDVQPEGDAKYAHEISNSHIIMAAVNRRFTVEVMSKEALNALWARHDALYCRYILQCNDITTEQGKELVDCDTLYNLLKEYCQEGRSMPKELLLFFCEHLLRDIELLKLHFDNANKVDDEVLLNLVTQLSASSEGAKELLKIYSKRKTLSDDVVKALVEVAIGDFVNEGKTWANTFLVDVIKEHGISTENADLFFKNADELQAETLTNLIKLRVDLDKVGKSAYRDENREEWLAYCGIRKNFSPEAQVEMKEWQYDYFRQTNHELDDDVIYELLVKRLSKDDRSFFEKVLKEAEKRDCLSETAQKLMMMTPWKREIILQHLAKYEKEKGYITL